MGLDRHRPRRPSPRARRTEPRAVGRPLPRVGRPLQGPPPARRGRRGSPVPERQARLPVGHRAGQPGGSTGRCLRRARVRAPPAASVVGAPETVTCSRSARGGSMQITYSPEQEQLRQELRAYYTELLTPEVEEQLSHSEGIGPDMRRIVRQMGADGWLGVGWPKEYGGRGFTAIEQFLFFDESMRAGAPVPMLTINTVGPTIMDFGTDEQKAEFLPRILTGEVDFCIGYTEP